MKKTITILGAIAIAGAPALALNNVPYKSKNLQNILQVATTATAKPNIVVNNDIIVQSVSNDQFNFDVTLSNSDYNGFPGFMNQIDISSITTGQAWAIFFFQWLNDNQFIGNFPDLNQHTKQGAFHSPFAYSSRLETYMKNFGIVLHNKSTIAWNMIKVASFWKAFGQNVETVYNRLAPVADVAGIQFYFKFSYHSTYFAEKPYFTIITN